MKVDTEVVESNNGAAAMLATIVLFTAYTLIAALIAWNWNIEIV